MAFSEQTKHLLELEQRYSDSFCDKNITEELVEECYMEIEKAIAGNDPNARLVAERLLDVIYDENKSSFLIRNIEKLSKYSKRDAFRHFITTKSKESLKIIVPYIYSKDEYISYYAIDAIGELADSEYIPTLESAKIKLSNSLNKNIDHAIERIRKGHTFQENMTEQEKLEWKDREERYKEHFDALRELTKGMAENQRYSFLRKVIDELDVQEKKDFELIINMFLYHESYNE